MTGWPRKSARLISLPATSGRVKPGACCPTSSPSAAPRSRICGVPAANCGKAASSSCPFSGPCGFPPSRITATAAPSRTKPARSKRRRCKPIEMTCLTEEIDQRVFDAGQPERQIGRDEVIEVGQPATDHEQAEKNEQGAAQELRRVQVQRAAVFVLALADRARDNPQQRGGQSHE